MYIRYLLILFKTFIFVIIKILLYLYPTNKEDMTNLTTTLRNETQMTIRQIRQELFSTEKYTVIGADEMTNKESRDFLYEKDNQDEVMNVIDNGSHLLIWE